MKDLEKKNPMPEKKYVAGFVQVERRTVKME